MKDSISSLSPVLISAKYAKKAGPFPALPSPSSNSARIIRNVLAPRLFLLQWKTSHWGSGSCQNISSPNWKPIAWLFSFGPFSFPVIPQLTDSLLWDHASRIHNLTCSIFLIGHTLSAENKDNLLKSACHPVSPPLSDFLFEPVIKGKVFVNQKTPHSHLHCLWILICSLKYFFLPYPATPINPEPKCSMVAASGTANGVGFEIMHFPYRFSLSS